MASPSQRMSPWWYRARPFIFGAIYFAGFGIGSRQWNTLGPTVLWAGSRLGDAWTQALLALVALLAVAAWALRVWGASYLSADVVWNPDARGDRLIVDGPFRYVRNPLYLGAVLLSVALGAFAPPLGFAIIVLGNVLFSLALMHEERPVLRSRYGATFDAYAAAVPALLPRLTPATVPGTLHALPKIVEGLASEVFIGALALGTVVLSVMREWGIAIFYVLFAAGILVRVVQRVRARQHARSRPPQTDVTP